jgi:hypothetical protein
LCNYVPVRQPEGKTQVTQGDKNPVFGQLYKGGGVHLIRLPIHGVIILTHDEFRSMSGTPLRRAGQGEAERKAGKENGQIKKPFHHR